MVEKSWPKCIEIRRLYWEIKRLLAEKTFTELSKGHVSHLSKIFGVLIGITS